MKWLAPLFVLFALLTGPDGRIIYVAAEQVIGLLAPAKGECAQDAHTKIFTAAGSFCVAEDPEDVMHKLNASMPSTK